MKLATVTTERKDSFSFSINNINADWLATFPVIDLHTTDVVDIMTALVLYRDKTKSTKICIKMQKMINYIDEIVSARIRNSGRKKVAQDPFCVAFNL